jgi:hypothetical protein
MASKPAANAPHKQIVLTALADIAEPFRKNKMVRAFTHVSDRAS